MIIRIFDTYLIVVWKSCLEMTVIYMRETNKYRWITVHTNKHFESTFEQDFSNTNNMFEYTSMYK